jgi:hypothetical protein
MAENKHINREKTMKNTSIYVFVLLFSSQDPSVDVRQSAIALVGDLARFTPAQLVAHLDKFVLGAAENLNPMYSSVCNNASW